MMLNLVYFYHSLKHTHKYEVLILYPSVKGAERAPQKSQQYFFIITRTTNSIFTDQDNTGRKNPSSIILVHYCQKQTVTNTYTRSSPKVHLKCSVVRGTSS